MSIVRWDPFRELETLQGRMGRLFEEALGRPAAAEWTPGAWAPAVDILENEENIVVKAELPDMNEKDIEIRVEDNVLVLRGEKKFERDEKKDNYHLIESSSGAFNRSFRLPGSVDTGKIKAAYDKGVLRVTLPKKEETKPRTVKIELSKN